MKYFKIKNYFVLKFIIYGIPNNQLSIFRNYRTENKNDRIYSIDQKK